MTNPVRWTRGVVGVVGVVVAVTPWAVSAQGITVGVGPSSYDLSGTGTSWVASARVDAPIVSGLRWQAGLAVFRYETQFGQKVTLGFVETGPEWHLPLDRIPLVVGAGAGYALESGAGDNAFTVYGALGLDFGLPQGWGIRPEVRVRSVDPWVGTMADITVGVRLRFL